MIYSIPEYNLNKLLRRLEKLNLRIISYPNSTKLLYTVSSPYEKKIIINEEKYVVKFVDIDIINPVVSMNGWHFLASIEHFKDGNVIISKIYDVEIPERFRNSGSNCDHCSTKRFRKNTYLVYNPEDKRIYQVGSTCLTSYLGFDASLLVAHASFMSKLNEENDKIDDKKFSSIGNRAMDLIPFLRGVVASIRLYGYVSSKMVFEGKRNIATGKDVWNSFCPPFNDELLKLSNSPSAIKEVNDAISWVSNESKDTQYFHNIKTIVKSDYVTYSTANTAASIIASYFSYSKDNVDKNKIDYSNSQYVGEIGRRIDIRMKLESSSPYEGMYGTGYRNQFLTEDGSVVIWFTNKSFDVGKFYKGKATIKKHNEYNGIKQTFVNRCTLIEE